MHFSFLFSYLFFFCLFKECIKKYFLQDWEVVLLNANILCTANELGRSGALDLRGRSEIGGSSADFNHPFFFSLHVPIRSTATVLPSTQYIYF